MKPIFFLGDSLACLRGFAAGVRSQAGHALNEVQEGREPTDWKPMTTIATGVREIRVRDESGAFRVIYTANLPEAVLVLHAFEKKSQTTPKRDLDLATARLKAWKG